MTKNNMYTTDGRYKEFNFMWLVKPIVVFFLGLLLSFIQPFSLERIDTGHKGLKVNLTGNDRGVADYQYKTGWVVYNSWTEQIKEFPLYQQHIDYDDKQLLLRVDLRQKLNQVSTTHFGKTLSEICILI